jgi:3-deoxy-7-phosphoheptulonate synthase
VLETAAFLREWDVKIMRGGAYKPRTSPDSFQGVGPPGLEWLAEAARQHGMLTVSEVMDPRDLPLFQDTIDILQIGARNMHNFALLRAVGQTDKPVLLKRGFMASVEELLFAAEYIRREGNNQIVLCERGIRTFEPWTRNTLDLSCVALVQAITDYPIVVDLSNSLGRKDIVLPLARAALACGANGIMLEVHPDPENALCDGRQSLSFEEFAGLMNQLLPFLRAMPLVAASTPARKPQ